MKVSVYKTRDCSGEATDEVVMIKAPLNMASTIDKRGQGDQNLSCCIKMENADVQGTYTFGFGGDEEHTIDAQDEDKIVLVADNDNDSAVQWGSISNPARCAKDLHIKVSPVK